MSRVHSNKGGPMEGQEVQSAVAVIDNGKFGKREIRFETGRLARQAAGAQHAHPARAQRHARVLRSGPSDLFKFFQSVPR